MVVALIILGGAVFFAMREGPGSGEDTSKNFTFNGEDVVISALYQSCAAGDRCIVVDENCGFCCHYMALNARYEREFNTAFDKSCRKYKGSTCSCFDLSSYPACVNGKCQLVAWPKDTKNAPRPKPAPESPPQTVHPAVPVAPQPQQQFSPRPQAIPQPSPQPAPQPGPQENFGQQDNVPPASNDDLYAPLPKTLPQQDNDLYAPLGGTNSSSQGANNGW